MALHSLTYFITFYMIKKDIRCQFGSIRFDSIHSICCVTLSLLTISKQSNFNYMFPVGKMVFVCFRNFNPLSIIAVFIEHIVKCPCAGSIFVAISDLNHFQSLAYLKCSSKNLNEETKTEFSMEGEGSDGKFSHTFMLFECCVTFVFVTWALTIQRYRE